MFRSHLSISAVSVLLITLLPQVVTAQTWSLEQAISAAIDSHPSVLASLSSSAAAKAEQEGAEWQRYPSVSLEAGHESAGGSALVRVQQPLWAGGRIDAGIAAAGRRYDAATAAVDEIRQQTAFEVIAAFIEAQRQQERQEYAAAGVKEHEKLLKMISRRVEREVSPEVDKQFTRSRLLVALNELSAALQARTSALAQLSQLTGSRVEQVLPVRSLGEVPATLQEAIDLARDHSPVLKRLAFEEAAALQDIESRRAVYLPQLALRLEHSYDNTTGVSSSDNRVMLVLEAQPGAGLSALSGVKAAIAQREAVRFERESALRDLQQQVELDWNELVAARIRLDNARQTRRMSANVFSSYARQYTAGRKTWIDVLNAVRETTQAELAVADMAAQVAAASLRLRLLTGSLLLANTTREHRPDAGDQAHATSNEGLNSDMRLVSAGNGINLRNTGHLISRSERVEGMPR